MSTAITQAVEKYDEIEKAMAGKELGDEIERLRVKAGWSQEELAHIIGLHQSRVSKMEKGEHNFPLETVYRLALAFGINPFELAAIYWGIGVEELSNKDKDFLNNILKLFDDYRKDISTPLLPHQQLQPYQPDAQDIAGKEEGMKIHRARSAARKRTSQKENQPKDKE